jgi:hypothetical protein
MQIIKITMNPSVKECSALSERFKYSAVGKNLLQVFEFIGKIKIFQKVIFFGGALGGKLNVKRKFVYPGHISCHGGRNYRWIHFKAHLFCQENQILGELIRTDR